MGELSKLPNIGAVIESQLQEIGIHTPQELSDTGSRQAWLKIKSIDPSACLNRLYALEGAIHGIRWHNLPDTVKMELKEFYRSFL